MMGNVCGMTSSRVTGRSLPGLCHRDLIAGHWRFCTCLNTAGRADAETVGQSTTKQRQVFCRVETAGTDARPDLAGQSHECVETALAKEKCHEE